MCLTYQKVAALSFELIEFESLRTENVHTVHILNPPQAKLVFRQYNKNSFEWMN